MNNIKLTLSYDGTDYHGWQKTSSLASIEEELTKALSIVLQKSPKLQAASRTDAGVHAKEQVVNFFIEEKIDFGKVQFSLNQLLPSSICVTSISKEDEDFHPTLSSVAKEYEYLLTTQKYLDPFKRNSHWHYPKDLDLDLMKQAAKKLIGKKDFKALTNFKLEPYDDTIRTLYSINIEKRGADYLMRFIGDHFLYKMARNLAGLLAYVGARKIELSSVDEILEKKLRRLSGITAPAKGLTLKKIYYDTKKLPFAVK